ncbi:YgcG family protein [Pusillimonas sp. CC-YST705]|uniref:YgcG family protein n=1 Tax=Mesopusillimonas faecipullorum TaxID=2755040 RepID=A0ABS8CF18_9BURK|nr:YgcG family protein [Mesopusillimonas faecipullorum]MCB5364631.1 YgcG family protein [Mesopusillimonas faecipullorum]
MGALSLGHARVPRLAWLLGAWLCCLAAWWPVWAQQAAIPALQERVTDTTGTLDTTTVNRLTQALAALEQEKGAQIAVLMVPTTQGEAIEGYAQRAFEQWKLGRKGVDDGILFVIAKDDRRLRIEVGYGLEGAVTDLQAGRIIREQVAPHFQQGDFAGGVVSGVDSLIKLVEGEALPEPSASVADEASSGSFLLTLIEWLAPLAIAVVALPPLWAAAGTALALYWLTGGSVVAAAVGAMVAFLLSLAGRSAGSGPRGGSSSVSRRGGVIGGGLGSSRAGWGHGRGGGGFGGGGFGGGGGRSGGGGASGGW